MERVRKTTRILKQDLTKFLACALFCWWKVISIRHQTAVQYWVNRPPFGTFPHT
jgi:hypothetical protein